MIQRAATGPIDELAGIIVDLRARMQTQEIIAHRHLFDLDPTPWTAVTFQNAWADLGGIWQLVEYRRVGDVTQIRGAMSGGTIGAAAFVLPVGYRPPAALAFSTTSNNLFGSFSVAANGTVTPNVGSNVSFFVVCQFSVSA